MRLATSQFRGSKNLSVDVFALRSDDAASGEMDNAYGFLVGLPNDLWSANLGFKRIGDDSSRRWGLRRARASARRHSRSHSRRGPLNSAFASSLSSRSRR